MQHERRTFVSIRRELSASERKELVDWWGDLHRTGISSGRAIGALVDYLNALERERGVVG